ncbi:MAG: hypothetical protein M1486_02385, partial [Gammaproteobacteria bacterium]|nr:hypothetical protein [Gammaproteobacteria bacterium]
NRMTVFTEFHHWLKRCSKETHFINPYSIIRWNMDKHYLGVLQSRGINIPPTLFIEQGDTVKLNSLLQQTGWNKVILKPAISGGARHTYLINKTNVHEHEAIYRRLIANESMLLQDRYS